MSAKTIARPNVIPEPKLPSVFSSGVPSKLQINGALVSFKPDRLASKYYPSAVNRNDGRDKKAMLDTGQGHAEAIVNEVYSYLPKKKPPLTAPNYTKGDIIFRRIVPNSVTESTPNGPYAMKGTPAMNYYLWRYHGYECNQTADSIIAHWLPLGAFRGTRPIKTGDVKLAAPGGKSDQTDRKAVKQYEVVQYVPQGECQGMTNIWMASAGGKKLDKDCLFAHAYLLLKRRYFDEDIVKPYASSSDEETTDDDDDEEEEEELWHKYLTKPSISETALPPPLPTPSIDSKDSKSDLAAEVPRPFYWRWEPYFTRIGQSSPDAYHYSDPVEGWTGAMFDVGIVNWIPQRANIYTRSLMEQSIYPKKRDWLLAGDPPTCSIIWSAMQL